MRTIKYMLSDIYRIVSSVLKWYLTALLGFIGLAIAIMTYVGLFIGITVGPALASEHFNNSYILLIYPLVIFPVLFDAIY